MGRGLGAAGSDAASHAVAILVGQCVQARGEGGEGERRPTSTRRNAHGEPIRWTGQRHGRRERRGPSPEADEDGTTHGLPEAGVPESAQEAKGEEDLDTANILDLIGIFDHYSDIRLDITVIVDYYLHVYTGHEAGESARGAAVEPPERRLRIAESASSARVELTGIFDYYYFVL